MAWQESSVMDEKLRFIAEYLKDQETIADLCRAFGISRKTGYKIIDRYKAIGLDGLRELSRKPQHSPHAVPDEVIAHLVEERLKHPRWGPRKLLAFTRREHPDMKLPAASTVGEVLKRFGLIKPTKRRPRTTGGGTPFSDCSAPNDIWCADFKGWFHSADGTRCEPLTVSDAHSRFLLKCQMVPNTRFSSVRPILEAAFREYGLPKAMRTDNGPPFASVGLGGLSSLTVWLTHLGIVHERIVPGRPQQNGRHERMHRTLKQETALPPQPTLGQQQHAFDDWREEYNKKRPHEALGQKTPAEVYRPSERRYPDVLPEIVYPVTFVTRPIKMAGQFFWDGVRVYALSVLNGETLGFESITPRYWRVWFGTIQLATFDTQTFKLIPTTRPAYERVIRTTAPPAQAPPWSTRASDPPSSDESPAEPAPAEPTSTDIPDETP